MMNRASWIEGNGSNKLSFSLRGKIINRSDLHFSSLQFLSHFFFDLGANWLRSLLYDSHIKSILLSIESRASHTKIEGKSTDNYLLCSKFYQQSLQQNLLPVVKEPTVRVEINEDALFNDNVSFLDLKQRGNFGPVSTGNTVIRP